MHDTGGLRERKKAETRRAIAAAALDLASRKGAASVTVDDIAEAADVSPRTVFNHFPTKEAAILGVDPLRRLAMLERLAHRPPEEPPLTAFVAATRDYYTPDWADQVRARAALVQDNPQLHDAWVASFCSLEDDLTRVIAARTGLDPERHPYPRLVAEVAVTAMRSAVRQAIQEPDHITIEQSLADTFASLASGLAPPAPPARSPATKTH